MVFLFCVNDDSDTIKVNKMVNARDFVNKMCGKISNKYFAAILDAIYDFSKCSRVTGWHTADCHNWILHCQKCKKLY